MDHSDCPQYVLIQIHPKGLREMYLWSHSLRYINEKRITKYPVGSDFGYHLMTSLMINAKFVYQDT